MIATNLVRLTLLGGILLAAAPCGAVAAAGKPPKIRLHFSGLLPGRSYTITLSEGATFLGEAAPGTHVKKSANQLILEIPEAPKGSDGPEIEEAMIESEVEVTAKNVTYQVELSGRTTVEIDLLGEIQVRGRPLQLNGVPFTFELPIPDLPAGWVLRAPPCPADPATRKERSAAVHAGWSACRPLP